VSAVPGDLRRSDLAAEPPRRLHYGHRQAFGRLGAAQEVRAGEPADPAADHDHVPL
jgi:hypothetical protein